MQHGASKPRMPTGFPGAFTHQQSGSAMFSPPGYTGPPTSLPSQSSTETAISDHKQLTETNIARHCRIGQELVHEIVHKSTEVFHVLKATQVGVFDRRKVTQIRLFYMMKVTQVCSVYILQIEQCTKSKHNFMRHNPTSCELNFGLLGNGHCRPV